jgi:hypothetical protein
MPDFESITGVTLTGRNQGATRFVNAPVWEWQPVAGAAQYEFLLASDDPRTGARMHRVREPRFDMSTLWEELPYGAFDFLILALDVAGRQVGAQRSRRFYKVPGWSGEVQEPLDYTAAVRRNLAYLLAPARDEVREYERGLPRSCWSNFEDSPTGQRVMMAYPALHHPSMITALLLFAEEFPDDTMAPEALRQARQYGNWLLENRQPAEWVCSLFPYSTIAEGRLQGGNEGRNITLFRAARVGEAMLALHRFLGDDRYLSYAHHLAEVYVKLQRADGSWPYRVDPQTGAVAEEYTSNALTPARLLRRLAEVYGENQARYRQASDHALQWVLSHPAQTYLWQGMYEDVGEFEPYQNLENWDTNEAIRFFCLCEDGDPRRKAVAMELNRWIENHFVLWQPERGPLVGHYLTPTAMEQFTCYFPMEVHTGNWLMSLVALHAATGRQEYYDKGIAAANAIVRGQQATGAFSTWGHDVRFGRPLQTLEWPGCNAFALSSLILWNRYARIGSPSAPMAFESWLQP